MNKSDDDYANDIDDDDDGDDDDSHSVSSSPLSFGVSP